MELTNESKSYHVENAIDTVKLSGEVTIKANGFISINGQIRSVADPMKGGNFNYSETFDGGADILVDAKTIIEATIAAIKAGQSKTVSGEEVKA